MSTPNFHTPCGGFQRVLTRVLLCCRENPVPHLEMNHQHSQLSGQDGTLTSRRKQRLPMYDGLLSGCERLRLTVRDEQRVVMLSTSGW